ncbi:MAG: YMGG-like glycine zipper-containing protein, partial [Candidatus Omnitrophota bacterium]
VDSWLPSLSSNQKQRFISTGKGALLGGGLGYLLTKHNRGRAAAIGAGIGGVLGYTTHDYLKKIETNDTYLKIRKGIAYGSLGLIPFNNAQAAHLQGKGIELSYLERPWFSSDLGLSSFNKGANFGPTITGILTNDWFHRGADTVKIAQLNDEYISQQAYEAYLEERFANGKKTLDFFDWKVKQIHEHAQEYKKAGAISILASDGMGEVVVDAEAINNLSPKNPEMETVYHLGNLHWGEPATGKTLFSFERPYFSSIEVGDRIKISNVGTTGKILPAISIYEILKEVPSWRIKPGNYQDVSELVRKLQNQELQDTYRMLNYNLHEKSKMENWEKMGDYLFPGEDYSKEKFWRKKTVTVVDANNERFFTWEGPVYNAHGKTYGELLYSVKHNKPMGKILEEIQQRENINEILLVMCNAADGIVDVPQGMKRVILGGSTVWTEEVAGVDSVSRRKQFDEQHRQERQNMWNNFTPQERKILNTMELLRYVVFATHKYEDNSNMDAWANYWKVQGKNSELLPLPYSSSDLNRSKIE